MFNRSFRNKRNFKVNLKEKKNRNEHFAFCQSKMNENSQDIFLTSINDDDVKSSTNSESSIRAKTEIEQILQSSVLIAQVESVNDITGSLANPSKSMTDEPGEVVIPKSVYNYASMVHQILESPRQNKLEHDITAVLGTSDPPPGFGFLHPRFYYLEQKRPIPLEPLQVCIERTKKKKKTYRHRCLKVK